VDDEDLNGYLMYPKVFMDYRGRHRLWPGPDLPTKTFFYGMEPGDEITAEIDPGKTLESACKPWARPPMTARSRCSSN
jgi:pyruvate carboxylase